MEFAALFLPHFEARDNSHDNIRCLPTRMGSSLSRGDNRRVVDDRGGLFPHQSLGVEGSLPCPSVLPEGESLTTCPDQAGQSDSNLIFESYGRTIPFPLVSTGSQYLELVPFTSDYPSCRISTWNREYYCRLGVEAPSQQQRLGTLSINVRRTEQVTGSILNRFVCFQNQLPIANILQLEA